MHVWKDNLLVWPASLPGPKGITKIPLADFVGGELQVTQHLTPCWGQGGGRGRRLLFLVLLTTHPSLDKEVD